MVIDTSALLSILFNEESSTKILGVIERSTSELFMSTVNLAETLILVQDRQPKAYERIRVTLKDIAIGWIAPDFEQAEIASIARMKYPLNLGDCFAYALAKSKNDSLLTLDKDFKKTGLRIEKI